MSETIVLAIGGNSLISDSGHVTVHDQYDAAFRTAKSLANLWQTDHKIALVHGNGPQVGFILRRAEIARDQLHSVPLDSCVADTQGALGYNIQIAIRNVMSHLDCNRPVSTIVTEVLVDKHDPSFKDPSKPIGTFMSEKEAKERQSKDRWDVAEDAGRGWRRVVPSPRPKELVEIEVIKNLVESGCITIAAGGGGIPVIKDAIGEYEGVEAVIDKDLAAALLAKQLNADKFIISTAVDKVCLNFGKPNEKKLDKLTVADAKKYIAEGQFGKGSMLPKIEAMVEFVEATGKTGLITDPAHLEAALEGKDGTVVVP